MKMKVGVYLVLFIITLYGIQAACIPDNELNIYNLKPDNIIGNIYINREESVGQLVGTQYDFKMYYLSSPGFNGEELFYEIIDWHTEEKARAYYLQGPHPDVFVSRVIEFEGENVLRSVSRSTSGIAYSWYHNNFWMWVSLGIGERSVYILEKDIQAIVSNIISKYKCQDVCGNGICDSGETCSSCSADCGQTCTDYDNGENIYQAGQTSWDCVGGGSVSAGDSCEDDNTLSEGYCENNQIKFKDIPCPSNYKCTQGRCTQISACSFPNTISHPTTNEISSIILEYYAGKCTKKEVDAAISVLYGKCPYPENFSCKTEDEMNIIIALWKKEPAICSMNIMNECIGKYNQANKCSYPSKYDCTTEEGFNIIKQEWQQGKCSDEIWPLCVANYNANKPKCSYPSKYDCDTQAELDIITNEWKQGICSMDAYRKCIGDDAAYQPKCGDGKCNGEETCSTCPSDCRCTSYEQCINGVCQGYCGNSRKDYGETCSSCPTDVACSSTQECVNGVCISKCGNGRLDPGETCSSCLADARCGSGLTCKNGVCVGCIKDSQCKSSISYSGEFICSPDHKRVLEKGVKIEGFCRNGECIQKENDITKEVKNCNDLYCQEGRCGCSEGYDVCPKTEKCEKQFALEENAKCGCDFQCNSGYCSDGRCLNALDIVFSSTKSELKPGEEATITLSVSNNLNKEIQFSGTANIGTGSEMVEIISGDDCSGNQCKIAGNLDEMGREETTIVVKSHSEKPIPLSATVGYNVDNKELEVHKEEIINKEDLTKISGNVVAEKTIGADPIIGIVIVLGIVIFGFGMIYLTYNLGRSHSRRDKK